MQSFTLYAIYGVADQWGEEKFDTSLLPFDVAEGVRIEDVSAFIRDGTFKFVETRMGSDDAKELQNTHYALVHRFDATTTFKNGDIVQEDEHNGRSEQLIRKIAACLRLIRPMRQAAQYMQGYVRKDGTFDVVRFQSPANLLEVPDVQKLWHLRDRDADDCGFQFLPRVCH